MLILQCIKQKNWERININFITYFILIQQMYTHSHASSMSSISPLPSIRLCMCFTTSTISDLSKILWSTDVFFLNFADIFSLPTEDKSYLSELKNKLLNKVSAVSIVGGSPGLKILNISNKASSLDLALSNCNVLLK